MTGGLYLYSPNVRDVSINDNVFSDNCGFQIGYSELFLKDSRSWQTVAREKEIAINGNLIDGRNTIGSPIESGGNVQDRVKIYAANGRRAILGDPMFKNPANQDFMPRRSSPAAAAGTTAGAYAFRSPRDLWWKQNFPPQLFRGPLQRAQLGN
jgi:hypothetical protein